MRALAFLFLFLVLGIALPAPAHAQSQEEIDFARRLLDSLQKASIAQNREFCGIIGITNEGELIASTPRRGTVASCEPREPRGIDEAIASFHTHAGFDDDYDSEVPSADDIIGDMEDGLDGYVATPGGRLWFIDGQSGTARQICGLTCLTQDPNFVPEVYGPVKQSYTLGEIEQRE
jgi:hypothetical protein